jgi:hypothetical protein
MPDALTITTLAPSTREPRSQTQASMAKDPPSTRAWGRAQGTPGADRGCV